MSKELKTCKGFKIGEWVEQISHINKEDSRLCKIISFEKKKCRVIVVHEHLNKGRTNRIDMIGCFKKIPKLKRLLKYGV